MFSKHRFNLYGIYMNIHEQDSKWNDKGNNEDPPEEVKSNDELPKEWKASRDHPLDNIFVLPNFIELS